MHSTHACPIERSHAVVIRSIMVEAELGRGYWEVPTTKLCKCATQHACLHIVYPVACFMTLTNASQHICIILLRTQVFLYIATFAQSGAAWTVVVEVQFGLAPPPPRAGARDMRTIHTPPNVWCTLSRQSVRRC